MENASSSFFNDRFCNKCLFIFKNCNQINTQNDLNVNEIFEIDDENKSQDYEMNIDCKFCFGILNDFNFSKIVEQIKNKIIDYEMENYKITTNFSPLFTMIHTYVFYFNKFSGDSCQKNTRKK